ncbi:hypothetical protein CPLU01_04930 [Colletotrichum plurivorum]|uniref:Uncharacterized protein n=1 Tax=Colletotrichum plurivorum TaxID=2175906 RepID=A0A8H6KNR0_9PEZI|nr:hypothetical protein CPLU01_04930 [Colletotrichum plurivorum]
MSLGEWFSYINDTRKYTTGRTLAIGLNGPMNPRRTTPTELFFTSYYTARSATTNATCSLTMTYAEVDVACHEPVCGALGIRQLEKPAKMKMTTVFDGLGSIPKLDPFMSTFVQSALTAWDTDTSKMIKPYSSPIETYFTNPDSPDVEPKPWVGTYLLPVGDVVFSQRFTQLLNTMWIAAIGHRNITSSFDFQASTGGPSGDYMRVRNATGTRTPDQLAMRVNVTWIAILLVASLIMLLSGVAAGVFGCMRRGPDVLDRATFFLKESPHVEVRRQSSLKDGTSQLKRSWDTRVCVGDVRPTEETRYVALGTVGEAMPLSWQEKDRRYA